MNQCPFAECRRVWMRYPVAISVISIDVKLIKELYDADDIGEEGKEVEDDDGDYGGDNDDCYYYDQTRAQNRTASDSEN